MSDDRSTDGLATVASGAGWVFGGNVLKLGILFSLQIIMARLLQVESYGGVALASAVINIGAIVGELGLDSGLVRAIPYYEDDVAEVRGVIKAGFLISGLVGLTVGVTMFFAAPIIATRVFREPSTTVLLRIAAIGIPFSVLIDISIAMVRGSRDARPQVLIRQIIDPVLRITLISALIVAGYGAAGAIGGEVIAIAVSGIVALVIAVRLLPLPIRGRTVWMHRELLTFSVPLMFSSGMVFLILNTDTFLIGTFLDSASVGTYNAAFRLQDVGMLFLFPTTFLLGPVLTRFGTQNERVAARRIYQTTTKWAVFLTFPLFLLMFLFPELVIRYSFGTQYVEGARSLQILMIPIMTTVLFGANDTALVSLGHNKIVLYVNVLVATLNIVLNVLLIPRIGIEGAALASAAAFILRDNIYSVFLYHWERIHPFSTAMVKPVSSATVFVVLEYAVLTSFLDPSIVGAIGFMFAFFIAYAFLIVSFGGIEAEDERLLTLVESRMNTELTTVRQSIRWLQRRN